MDVNKLLGMANKFLVEVTNISQKKYFKETRRKEFLTCIYSIQFTRESNRTLMNMVRMQSFIDSMQRFEDILFKIVSKGHVVEKVMACVWGPARFLLETANHTDEELDNLLGAYEKIGLKMPLQYGHEQLFINIPDCVKILVYIYEDVLAFHKHAYTLFSLSSTLYQKIYNSTWKDLEITFDYLAGSLENHRKFMEDNAFFYWDPSATLYMDSEQAQTDFRLKVDQSHQEISNILMGYSQKAEEYRDTFTCNEADRKDGNRREVLAWISASKKTPSLHKKLQEMRICPDTGRWILKRGSDVDDWITYDTPPCFILWIQADEGFGKSVLSSLIVDELGGLCTEEQKPSIPRESNICYFYCREDDPDHCTYLGILKGVLHQMVESTEYLLPLCMDSIKSSVNLTDTAAAERLVEAFFEYSTRRYIIIDGIDECESVEARKATEFFMKQAMKCDNHVKQGQLRLLFTSRTIPDLARTENTSKNGANAEITLDDVTHVRLGSANNADDIRCYVRKRILDFFGGCTTTSGFDLFEIEKQQIEDNICDRSKEMFLYAHLLIEYFLRQPTKEKLMETITEEPAPNKLSQIYEKLLGMIQTELLVEGHWSMARLLLGWLVCAKRPLQGYEMQSILSFDLEQLKVDFSKKPRKEFVDYLGPIVHVLEDGHIQVIHSRTRSHIIQNQYIGEQGVHCELAALCLRYLCLIGDSINYADDERRQKAGLGQFSFQDYACSQWHSHVDTVISKCGDFFGGDSYNGQKYKDMFGSALQQFVGQYGRDLTREPNRDQKDQFPAELSYQHFCTLWKRIYTHQEGTLDPNPVDIADIRDAMLKNRASLEASFSPDSNTLLGHTIADYYGSNIFKCNLPSCKFFYIGFEQEIIRDAHNERHEKPYRCPLRCKDAPCGFTCKKDLNRHVKNSHPELSNEPSVFGSRNCNTGAKNFHCVLCGKGFTRKITQEGHERSHLGERPYKCSHEGCSKAFGRKSDCDRHEKICKEPKNCKPAK